RAEGPGGGSRKGSASTTNQRGRPRTSVPSVSSASSVSSFIVVSIATKHPKRCPLKSPKGKAGEVGGEAEEVLLAGMVLAPDEAEVVDGEVAADDLDEAPLLQVLVDEIAGQDRDAGALERAQAHRGDGAEQLCRRE